MTEFFQKHKKPCIISGAVVSVIIFAVYLYLLFLPGFWYHDVFLYKEKSPFEGMEVYSGHDAVNKADYELTMVKEGKTAYLAFTVNETEKYYEIISDDTENHSPAVTISENGEQIFEGSFNGYHLVTKDGKYFEEENYININGFGSWKIPEEELFPSYHWIYNVSQSVKTEIRGEPLWLICIVLIAGLVILDMVHPDFFWNLNNWLDVKGGEPSDFYRFAQKTGWILSPILIFVLMIISFMPESMFL